MTARTTIVIVAAALIGSAGPAAAQSGLLVGTVDMIASVHQALLPGGTVFDDGKTLLDAQQSPKETAEFLHLAPTLGANFSGRSTSITSAFGSSLAESDGNGGVGVSAWLPGNPGSPNQNTTGQLAAQASWAQTFTYNGSVSATLSLQLHIPELQVGLIGVPPNRGSVSKTESALAQAAVDSVITHADGSTTPGGSFLFGLHELEFQILLGPGTFANFADVEFLGSATSLGKLTYNGDAFNPNWTFDPLSTTVKLGTLAPGDSVRYVYTLTAEGTTHGGEHGFYAFVGDPFGVDSVTGNLRPLLAPVPEPASAVLMLIGVAGMVASRRMSRRAS